MKILKSLTLLAALSFITINASAQSKSSMTPEKLAQKETDKVKKNVTGVTAHQESKILAVEQKYAKACDKAKTEANGDKDAYKSKKKLLYDKRDTKIKSILNESQYAQYTKMEAPHKKTAKKSTVK